MPLDGLAVVAAVSGDGNLSVREIGGEVTTTSAALFADARATAAQRQALVAMAKTLSKRASSPRSSRSRPADRVRRGDHDIRVTPDTLRLTVHKHMNHDTTCGNKQWFEPFSAVDHADMGIDGRKRLQRHVARHKWSDPNKRSAFFGTFSY